MQIGERLLNPHQVGFSEPATDIYIPRDQRDTMRHGSESAHDDELNLRRNQTPYEFAKVLHSASPLRREAIPQSSTHRH